jgi:hypothetical protein
MSLSQGRPGERGRDGADCDAQVSDAHGI